MIASVLMPAVPAIYQSVNKKIDNYYVQLKIEKTKKEELKRIEAEIEATRLIMNQVLAQILLNRDEDGNLIQDVVMKLTDRWGETLVVSFPSKKEATIKSLGPDKIVSSDDLFLSQRVEEEKPRFVKSLINKFK